MTTILTRYQITPFGKSKRFVELRETTITTDERGGVIGEWDRTLIVLDARNFTLASSTNYEEKDPYNQRATINGFSVITNNMNVLAINETMNDGTSNEFVNSSGESTDFKLYIDELIGLMG